LRELRCLDISFNSLSSLRNDSYFNNVNIFDYLPSDSSESCLTTEVPSSVLKLKADNNPWNCDCDMKGFFDIIFKNVSPLPNLTCKGPPEYENKQWEVLEDVDCSSTVAPTGIRMTEESVTVSVRTSSVANSATPEDTEKPTTNNEGPQTATLMPMSIVSIILLSVVFGSIFSCAVFIGRCLCRLKRNRVRTPYWETENL